MKMFMKKAGSAVPSANRITLLRDGDGDGVAEVHQPYITGLSSPFGMVLVGSTLYVPMPTPWLLSPMTRRPMQSPPVHARSRACPPSATTTGPRASPPALTAKLYVGVGSNSNVAEHGMAEERGPRSGVADRPRERRHPGCRHRVAQPGRLAFRPGTGELYAVVNERDELGSDLVPDYLTSVRDGAFYGWPWSYYGDHVDARVEPSRPDMAARAVAPDYALGSHVAPLGLAFADGAQARPELRQRRLHRRARLVEPPPVQRLQGRVRAVRRRPPSGQPVDVLSGFLRRQAMGRPVGVAIARDGALLVADDVGNTVWRVSAASVDARTDGLRRLSGGAPGARSAYGLRSVVAVGDRHDDEHQAEQPEQPTDSCPNLIERTSVVADWRGAADCCRRGLRENEAGSRECGKSGLESRASVCLLAAWLRHW
jgi:glucose/arabinose dehydrogenase